MDDLVRLIGKRPFDNEPTGNAKDIAKNTLKTKNINGQEKTIKQPKKKVKK